MAFIETTRNDTFRIKAGYYAAVEKAMRKACLDIEAAAKRNVRDQGAIDTGALRASIYTDTRGVNGHASAESRARAEAGKGSRNLRRRKSKGPAKRFDMLPEVKAGAMEGVVAVGAEYGLNVEAGTVHMPPRPYFDPAVDEGFRDFDKNVVDMVNREVR